MVNRRDFLGSLACGALAAYVPPDAALPEQSAMPNILLIHGDEHRIDCLGAYGNGDIQTPNLDALAADGEHFENSFCPYPVCTPSRYSMLSGRSVHEHRGWTNRCTLPPGIETFPSLLKQKGYRTKAVGKMHFTPTYLDVGFDTMVLAEQDGPGRWDDDYHRDLMKHGLVDRNDLEDQRPEYRKNARDEYWKTFGAMPTNLPEGFDSTAWIAGHAAATLEQWSGSGNLLMVGFIKPHHPFDPAAAWKDRYDPNRLALLPGWTEQCFPHDLEMNEGYFPHRNLTEIAMRRITAYYYAAISHIDDHVGRMIRVLKRNNLYDSTMILYTSDHGDYMGFHHMLLKGNYMYDPLVKVPLIIKYPGNRKRGTVSKSLVSNIDLAPTILRRAGCRPAEGMDGFDLLQNNNAREFVFAHGGKGTNAMARSRTRKLLLARSKQTLFFDLQSDPLEMSDASQRVEYKKEMDRFRKAIEAWEGPDPFPDPYLDENAPQIRGANVPPSDGSHRPGIIEYYRRRMAGG